MKLGNHLRNLYRKELANHERLVAHGASPADASETYPTGGSLRGFARLWAERSTQGDREHLDVGSMASVAYHWLSR